MRVYRQLGQIGIVWSLQTVMFVEERQLLYGHIAVHLGDFDTAERMFLQSTQPQQALDVGI